MSPSDSHDDDENTSQNENATRIDNDVVSAFEQFISDVYQDELEERADFFEDSTANYVAFPLDYEILEDYDEDLARGLSEKPDTFYKAAEQAVQTATDSGKLQEATLRITNHGKSSQNLVPIRELRANHVNQLISVEGIIKKATGVLPKVAVGAFRCYQCGSLNFEDQPTKYLEQPDGCSNCDNTKSFELEYRESEIVDYQKLTIQEAPEGLKGGETPQSVDVYITGGITGRVTPGERVTVTGTLRADVDPSNDTPVFSTFLDGKMVDQEEQEFDEVEMTDEDVEAIHTLAQRDDIYTLIPNSIAPALYGYENLKKATMYQLFAGVTKRADGTYLRGDIHMLYIGDPGTGKSQLLQYIKKLAPRGVYTVGQGASSAGLTAAAVKETDLAGEQKWTLEAGALVLADKGIACVDEVDKMDSSDRSALHEALEQQQVSVAKAGINATLKSRCSMLAAANPKYGRFDEHEAISEQIDLEPALVSRFDLIFKILDRPSEDKDRRLARHVINSNKAATVEDEEGITHETIDPDLLRKYVAYARKNCRPSISEAMEQKLEDFYVKIRNEQDTDAVPVTARALQALIRLAEASARVRLADTVNEEDAERAIEIMEASLEEVSIDPETGELDADKVEASATNSQRKRRTSILDIIDDVAEESEEGEAKREDVFEVVEEKDMDVDKVEDEIEKLKVKGELIEPRTNYLKTL